MARIEPAYEWEPLSQQEFDDFFLEFELFCEHMVRVTDKNGDVVPFMLNEAQLDYSRVFFSEYLLPKDRHKPLEHIILKARQIGMSTVVAVLIAYTCMLLSNNSMEVAYVMPKEADAIDFLQRKFQPLLEGMHPDVLPEIQVNKKGTYLFVGYGSKAEVLNNRVSGMSAGTKSAGKSKTIRGLILDEYAEYRNAVDFERGIMATVPKTGRSYKLLFSTAKGQNHFWEAWENSKNQNNWKHFFYPWHFLAEYEVPANPIKMLTPYQESLIEEFEKRGYPRESWLRKLAWYSDMLENEAKGSEEYMFENYPSFEDEAFLSSGRPAFSPKKMKELADEADENIVENGKPYIHVEFLEGRHDELPVAIQVARSPIKLFDSPDLSGSTNYLMGIDPADGGEHGDYSAICVVSAKDLKVVASFKAKVDQNELAEIAVNLARYFNDARMFPERNTGQAFIHWVRKQLRYTKIYADQKFRTTNENRYGVYMTRSVRDTLVGDLKFLIQNNLWKDYDPDFHDECKSFVYDDSKGKYIAESGKHDDVIMARVLLIAGLNMRSIYEKHGVTFDK